jgi:hypothetical protein
MQELLVTEISKRSMSRVYGPGSGVRQSNILGFMRHPCETRREITPQKPCTRETLTSLNYEIYTRRVCESNIVHAGSDPPFSLEITHIGEGGRPWLHEETWRDTESLSLTFQLTLSDRAGSESKVSGSRGKGQGAEIDSVHFILNNQTHGMMRLGDAGILEHSGIASSPPPP